jgi:hypothetical protein
MKLKPQPIPKELPTYSTTLSNGRVVVMRQAITQDLLLLQVGDRSTIEQGIYMMVRLSQEPRLTEAEIQVLPVSDFQALSALVSKCTGQEEEEEGENPFE